MKKTTSILIIGQGIAGTLLAWELYWHKIPFHLYASPVQTRSSMVAAGMYNPLVFKRLTQSWMADQLLPCMHATYQAIEKQLDISFVRPMQMVKPLTEQEEKLWVKKKNTLEIAPFIGGITKTAPNESILSFHSYGLVEGSGYINVAHFLDQSLLFFKKLGFIDETHVNYNDISIASDGVRLNDIHAKQLVFCEGYHGLHNPFFDKPFYSLTKGEILQIHAPNLSEKHILNRRVFVLPLGNHRFKVGSTYDWENINEQPTLEGATSILERLNTLIQTPYTVEDHWAGVRPTIKDRRPVLGFHPYHSPLAIFNGLGTKGVMIGPYFAKHMALLLLGKQLDIHPEINIQRFF